MNVKLLLQKDYGKLRYVNALTNQVLSRYILIDIPPLNDFPSKRTLFKRSEDLDQRKGSEVSEGISSSQFQSGKVAQ
jgi:hypothetical protein